MKNFVKKWIGPMVRKMIMSKQLSLKIPYSSSEAISGLEEVVEHKYAQGVLGLEGQQKLEYYIKQLKEKDLDAVTETMLKFFGTLSSLINIHYRNFPHRDEFTQAIMWLTDNDWNKLYPEEPPLIKIEKIKEGQYEILHCDNGETWSEWDQEYMQRESQYVNGGHIDLHNIDDKTWEIDALSITIPSEFLGYKELNGIVSEIYRLAEENGIENIYARDDIYVMKHLRYDLMFQVLATHEVPAPIRPSHGYCKMKMGK